MEELRSAEILHREIQNEARKKAEKLLQDADIASEFQLTEEEKEYKNFVQQFVVTVEE